MSKARFKSFFHFLVFRFGVRDGSQDTLRLQITGKIQCTRHFRRSIPTLDAMGGFHQRLVVFRIRFAKLVAEFMARTLRSQIRTFQVQTQYRAVLLTHQLLTNGSTLADVFESGRRHGWEYAGCTMFHVRFNNLAIGFFRTFGEVMSSATMSVKTNISRNDELPFGINKFCTFNGQITIGNLQYLIVLDEDRTVFYPSLRSKNTSVNNLNQHAFLVLLG